MAPGSDSNERIDELLRRTLAVPGPTPEELDRARRVYMASPLDPHRRKTDFRRPRVRGLAVVLAAVAVVAVTLVGVQLTRPSPAAAVFGEIAHAARIAAPLTIEEREYAYTRAETLTLGVVPEDAIGDDFGPLAYLLPQIRESWIGQTGVVQIRTTTEAPHFFDTGDRNRYYASGRDRIDGVGQTRVEIAVETSSILDERDWPTNPNQLAAAIRSIRPDHTPETILAIVLSLTRESRADPDLRAAAFEVAARIDGIELVRRTTTEAVFRLEVDDTPSRVVEFTLTTTGQLVQETLTLPTGDPSLGIPPGTDIVNIRYQPTRVVTNLDPPTDSK